MHEGHHGILDHDHDHDHHHHPRKQTGPGAWVRLVAAAVVAVLVVGFLAWRFFSGSGQ